MSETMLLLQLAKIALEFTEDDEDDGENENDVSADAPFDVALQVLIGLSVSSRKSQTRNLLGDDASKESLGVKHRRFAIRKPIRVFFGDGSISDSETSEHDACDVSDMDSKSICIGDDVTYRGILSLTFGENPSLLRLVIDCTSTSDFLIRKLAIDREPIRLHS